MPRQHQRKTTTNYDPTKKGEIVEEALNSPQSICSIAKKYNVPKTTLLRWVKNPTAKTGSGGTTVLSQHEEELLATAIAYLARYGFPQDRTDIIDMTESFVTNMRRVNPFKDNRPGIDWVRGFEKRQKKVLTRRKPELLTTNRAEALTQKTVDLFFKNYTEVLEANGLKESPHRIFNLDETGLTTDPRSEKVFIPRGDSNAYEITPTNGKTSYTVLFCTSATGNYAPPFILYKGKHCYSAWMYGGPAGATYGCSDSGWMEGQNFESWFKSFFVSHVSNLEKPVLVIYDGHNSHLTYNTVKTAMDNQIIIMCLPPNTSHALQPLDVGVFKALKVQWKGILKAWYRETERESIDKAVFPSRVKKLWEKLNTQHAVAGFRGSGLFPVNKEAVSHRIVTAPGRAKTTEEDSSINEPDLTPRKKAFCNSILSVVSPPLSDETASVLANKKRKRKRVQHKAGEVLTSEEALERLKAEEAEREAKKSKKVAKKLSSSYPKSQKPKPSENGEPSGVQLTDKNNDPDFLLLSDLDEDESQLITPIPQLKVNDWVLVNYASKSTSNYYVGTIIDFAHGKRKEDGDDWTVKYLRKVKGCTFKYPTTDDIDSIGEELIEKKLSEPVLPEHGGSRLFLKFKEAELAKYNVQ